MSTEPVPAIVAPGHRAAWRLWTDDLHTARVLRFAFGVTGAVALAFAFQWPLFFLTPVFVAVFLGLPVPGPNARQIMDLLLYVLAAIALGLCFTLFLMPYPLVYVPLLGLVLFHIYYLANRGGSLWLVLMSLVAVLILPLLGNTGDLLPSAFAGWFAWSSVLAIGLYVLAHVLFPDPAGGPAMPPKKPRLRGYAPGAANAALKSTIVILPLAVLFIAADWASQILVLVFAAIFSLLPDLAKGREAGNNSLISTLVGGLAALVVYWGIVAVPEFHFFVVAIFLAMLVFGSAIFAGGPNARYMGSAATTVIILIGSVMGDDVDFSDEFLGRLVLIAAATLYVIGALNLLERLSSARHPRGPA